MLLISRQYSLYANFMLTYEQSCNPDIFALNLSLVWYSHICICRSLPVTSSFSPIPSLILPLRLALAIKHHPSWDASPRFARDLLYHIVRRERDSEAGMGRALSRFGWWRADGWKHRSMEGDLLPRVEPKLGSRGRLQWYGGHITPAWNIRMGLLELNHSTLRPF